MANARHGANQVGARAQVGNFTQVFNAMAFSRHRISFRIVYPAAYFNMTGLNLKALALTLDSTTLPVTMTEQPVVRRSTS